MQLLLKIEATVLIALSALTLSSSFVLDGDPCPAPAQCHCFSNRITCINRGLDTWPTFTFTQNHYRQLTIDIHQNRITTIPDNAFNNINLAGIESINLKLSDNKINTIQLNAFTHLENVTTTLDLAQNRLTRLPQALIQLKRLQILRLLNNAIITLDRTVMSSMASSLKELELDMKSFFIWPLEFSLLAELGELIIDNIPFDNIPEHSFSGLVKLERLTITNSLLTKVPAAICDLQALQVFEFSNNVHIPNSNPNLLTPCTTPMNTTSVNLDFNNLYRFPNNVFAVFPYIRRLALSGNYLETIDDSVVPSKCTLYYLFLSHNHFTTIPTAVSKMPELLTLILSYNQITHIDGHVFTSLKNFRQLTINHNPIIHVDPNAFYNMFTFRELGLAYTNMTSIPAAILNSAQHFRLDLEHSPVECSCKSMAIFNLIPREEIESGRKFLYGTCVNSTITLKAYVLNTLPTC